MTQHWKEALLEQNPQVFWKIADLLDKDREATMKTSEFLRPDVCVVCGHPMNSHRHDETNASISCETLQVRDLARDLAFMDGTLGQLGSSPTLQAHYLKYAWMARRLSTMGPDREAIIGRMMLEGSDGCQGEYFDNERMMGEDLIGNPQARALWLSIWGAGWKRVMAYLGKQDPRTESHVETRWRSVMEERR